MRKTITKRYSFLITKIKANKRSDIYPFQILPFTRFFDRKCDYLVKKYAKQNKKINVTHLKDMGWIDDKIRCFIFYDMIV